LIEVAPQGVPHSIDWEVIGSAISLYCAKQGIPALGLINVTLRHPHVRQAPPDLAYLLRGKAGVIGEITGVIDLRTAPLPDIAIQLGATSFRDDLGPKRVLYEEMGVAEYWVEDVERTAMPGWAISGGTSTTIRESQAIPGLTFDLIEEALRLQRRTDLSQTVAMLLRRIYGIG
jgi:Uma2 family endonuclease